MKIKKLGLSDEVILAVAEDIASSFTVPKYEQFLTKHGLFSYNPNDYSYFNKIDFIRATLEEIDERLFLELDNKGVISDETKSKLLDHEVKFEIIAEIQPNLTTKNQSPQKTPEPAKKDKKSESLENPTSDSQSSLSKYTFAFFIVLVMSAILWAIFPNYAVFILIISTSIFIFLAISVTALKHEDKISDNAFISIVGKITEAVKSLAKK